MSLEVLQQTYSNFVVWNMIVVECPDCPADFAGDAIGDECEECGADLSDGAIKMLDFVVQCPQCEGRIGIQNITDDDNCPECGGDMGFTGEAHGQ